MAAEGNSTWPPARPILVDTESAEKPLEDHMIRLGEAIIRELGERGQRGMYFDFKGHCELRRVESVSALQSFLESRGYRNVRASEHVKEVVDDLQGEAPNDHTPWMLLTEPLASLLFAFSL